MGRSRYETTAEGKTNFVTTSTINWLPLFAIPVLAEIVIDSLNFMHHEGRMKEYPKRPWSMFTIIQLNGGMWIFLHIGHPVLVIIRERKGWWRLSKSHEWKAEPSGMHSQAEPGNEGELLSPAGRGWGRGKS